MWVEIIVKHKGNRFISCFKVFVKRIKMGGLVHVPGQSMKVIRGWGWERDTFVVHVEPLSWPQAL